MSWLFNKIADWISGALESAFSFLGDLLVSILWPFVKAVGEFIYTALAGVFYRLFVTLLNIIEGIQVAFNVFSGLDKVSFKSNPDEQMSLLAALFRMSTVWRAFAALIGVALALCVFFAILAVLRSMSDYDGQNGRPVSRVLSMTFRAMVRFVTLPLLCLVFVMLADALLASISQAMGTGNSTVSRIIFVTATMDAAKDQSYNIHPIVKDGDGNDVRSSTINTSRSIGINDDIRRPFYTGQKDYGNENAVKAVFELKWMDFLTGYFTAIFMILILGMACFTFVCRIFDCLVLVLVSPFFVATMPMDDGEKYKAWQDLFIGKLFSGYGTVVSMQLYLILCPLVMSNEITMVKGASVEMDYLVRILFLMGGAWAISQAGPMITSLINEAAGTAEMRSNAVGMAATAGGLKMAAGAALFTAKLGGKIVSAPFRSGKKGGKGGGSDEEKKGTKENTGGGFGAPSLLSKGKGGGGSDAAGGGAGGGGGLSLKEKGLGEGGFNGSGGKTGSGGYGGGVQTKSFLGGLITRNKRADGTTFTGFNFGFMKRGYDEKGNYGFKIFGMGSKVNKKGVKSWSFLGQKVSKDQNGKLHWTKRNFGLFTMKKGTKYDAKTGKFAGFTDKSSLSKLGIFGVRRKYNSATGKFQTQSALGMKFGVGTDGKNHLQSWGGLYKNQEAMADSARAANNWNQGTGLDGKGGMGGASAGSGGAADASQDNMDITNRGMDHLLGGEAGGGEQDAAAPGQGQQMGSPVPPQKEAAQTGADGSAPSQTEGKGTGSGGSGASSSGEGGGPSKGKGGEGSGSGSKKGTSVPGSGTGKLSGIKKGSGDILKRGASNLQPDSAQSRAFQGKAEASSSQNQSSGDTAHRAKPATGAAPGSGKGGFQEGSTQAKNVEKGGNQGRFDGNGNGSSQSSSSGSQKGGAEGKGGTTGNRGRSVASSLRGSSRIQDRGIQNLMGGQGGGNPNGQNLQGPSHRGSSLGDPGSGGSSEEEGLAYTRSGQGNPVSQGSSFSSEDGEGSGGAFMSGTESSGGVGGSGSSDSLGALGSEDMGSFGGEGAEMENPGTADLDTGSVDSVEISGESGGIRGGSAALESRGDSGSTEGSSSQRPGGAASLKGSQGAARDIRNRGVQNLGSGEGGAESTSANSANSTNTASRVLNRGGQATDRNDIRNRGIQSGKKGNGHGAGGDRK